MTFIGIIADERKEKHIEKVLIKYLKQKIKIIFINKNNIDNMKNIKFETILLLNNSEKLFNENYALKQIIENAKYFIINSDTETNLEILNNLNLNVITYGFNSKASITASSVTDEDILLCVQRNLQTIEGKIIESQEIRTRFNENIRVCTYNEIMGIASLLLIFDKKNVKI